jgi:folate-binding protein YgfZ
VLFSPNTSYFCEISSIIDVSIAKELPMKGILKISGPQAATFLQGQITCDANQASSTPLLGAHCNREGRVISLFYLYSIGKDYYMIMDADMVSITQAALKKYAVFFKVTLEDVTASNPANINLYEDSELIQKNIPIIYPDTSGKFLPHDLNLQLLNAIDFNKGCYTGQEIIARMHYRGKLKNYLYSVCFKTNAPQPGTEISSGTVVNSITTPELDCIGLIITTDEKKDNDENITHRTSAN